MTPTTILAPWHERFGGRIAGSVYAVAPRQRIAAARDLAGAGLDVHVDVMAEAEGLPAGVSLAELSRIAGVVDSARLGVHLIGSPAFVDATLPAVLAHRPATVFLPWAAFSAPRVQAVRAAGGAAWIAVWDEWDGSPPVWPETPDGVLVMLIEPGTADRARTDRLGIVSACAPQLPVIVDGGVTEDLAPLCITAGVESMVVGRALLPDPAKGRTP
ncbi:ribulose phosphate epimerase [Mycobacterium sp. WMMD1722]|uniref:ribulose phosphate epimerase n=1 Tax=Mycobacterium sp. WMMD1722 TaxID=3404117 RepID=UPI003BF505D1